MDSTTKTTPLVVIVGETASGKTSLAISLAKRFGGEIIAADSRTVYKGMDIGTAKPTEAEQQGVKHHLLDVVTPDQRFTVADFKELANKAMGEIFARGNLPILVGGSGLYIDAVVYDFQFSSPPDLNLRSKLQQKSVEELQKMLKEKGIALPTNYKNPRHLMRAIETNGDTKGRLSLRADILIIGLRVERDELIRRIKKRVEWMIERGYQEELQSLLQRYAADSPGLQAPGHKIFRRFFTDELSFETAKESLIREHSGLAKRQRTWFKRDKNINWIWKEEEAVELITTFLSKIRVVK